jgi:molecular chaperone GrpE
MAEIEQPIDQSISEPAERPADEPGGQPAKGEPNASEILEQLALAQAQAAEYLDNWRRATADLSNARKRMQREMDEYRAAASHHLLEKLLPVVDDVDRAFTVVPVDQAETDWVNGFRMIQRKLHSLLEGEGVMTIAAEGLSFDPAVHYAVTHEEADGFDDGQIIAELARGYKLNDKVLRPAMVRVAKG